MRDKRIDQLRQNINTIRSEFGVDLINEETKKLDKIGKVQLLNCDILLLLAEYVDRLSKSSENLEKLTKCLRNLTIVLAIIAGVQILITIFK